MGVQLNTSIKFGPSDPLDSEVALIEELVRNEGDSVTILSVNPEEIDCTQRQAIECNGEWTGWVNKRFYGRSLKKCLQAAYAECRSREEPQK
jgi:hypothetical protein